MYDLSTIMACTIDTVDEKNVCNQGRHYALNLLVKKSRKVYFTQYEQMKQCLDQIIELQGFGDNRCA